MPTLSSAKRADAGALSKTQDRRRTSTRSSTAVGFRANAQLRLVRHRQLEGKPQKNIVISRHNAYHGSTVAGTSLAGCRRCLQLGGAAEYRPCDDAVFVRAGAAWRSEHDFGIRGKGNRGCDPRAWPGERGRLHGEPIMARAA